MAGDLVWSGSSVVVDGHRYAVEKARQRVDGLLVSAMVDTLGRRYMIDDEAVPETEFHARFAVATVGRHA